MGWTTPCIKYENTATHGPQEKPEDGEVLAQVTGRLHMLLEARQVTGSLHMVLEARQVGVWTEWWKGKLYPDA